MSSFCTCLSCEAVELDLQVQGNT